MEIVLTCALHYFSQIVRSLRAANSLSVLYIITKV